MRTRNAPLVCAVVGLMALVAPVDGGEPQKADGVVAKVNGVPITRQELSRLRRFLTMGDPQLALDNRQILDYAINRLVWEPYLEKENLLPSAAEVQRATQQLDAQLRARGSSYRWIGAQGFTQEEHLADMRFELSMQRLAAKILAQLRPEAIKAEFDAHPEWYDGSRIRISEIFVDTRDLANDREKQEKAKQRIEKIHEQLRNGKDFGALASDYSDGALTTRGGDLGWFLRNGKPVDEHVVASAWPFEGPMCRPRGLEIPREPPTREVGPIISGTETPRRVRVEPLEELLVAAAWGLKVGEFTKPVQSARGWHILKVTEREGAHFTFFGARDSVSNALVRRRTEAILDKLRAAAKIETDL